MTNRVVAIFLIVELAKIYSVVSNSVWEDRLLDCATALIVALYSPLGWIPILINLMAFKSCTIVFVADTCTTHTSNTDADQILSHIYCLFVVYTHAHVYVMDTLHAHVYAYTSPIERGFTIFLPSFLA